LKKPPEEDWKAAISLFGSMFFHPSLTWAELPFLRRHTKLPILLKGILHPRDAELALQYGADGIIVSNHGGRQVDGEVATIDVLPDIIDIVRGRIPVLMDSGVRGGADIIKAIALGASAILIGRPYIYGLAVAG
ncbi:alpha-hydroxy-acid oxidizing protein, partial [Frankia sp. Cpl3]|nr:alpha-hydroxy-acid oxidizing protein [Frankia sp. Cpl3]